MMNSHHDMNTACKTRGQQYRKSEHFNICLTSLAGATKPTYQEASLFEMFCFPPRSPLSPKLERSRAKLPSHQFNDLAGRQSELDTDRIERRSILPSHLNDAVDVAASKLITFHNEQSSDLIVLGFEIRIFNLASPQTKRFQSRRTDNATLACSKQRSK